MLRNHHRAVVAATFCGIGIAVLGSAAKAATVEWEGSGTDPIAFDNADNWADDVLPGAGDIASFFVNTVNDPINQVNFGTLQLTDPGTLAPNYQFNLAGFLVDNNAKVGLDLNGHRLLATDMTVITPTGEATISNTSGTANEFRVPGELQVSDGGKLTVTGANTTFRAGTASTGVNDSNVTPNDVAQITVQNGATWINEQMLNIGASDSGDLTVESGAKLYGPGYNTTTNTLVGITYQATVGAAAGKTGNLSVTGSGSEFHALTLVVGGSGDGSLTVADGALVNTHSLLVGYNFGSTGTVTLDQATISTSDLTVYDRPGSGFDFNSGTLNINRSAVVTVQNNVTYTAFTVGDGGTNTATLNLGTTSLARNYRFNHGLHIAANGEVNLNHGSLRTTTLSADAGGAFNFNGGSLTLTSATPLTVGDGQLIESLDLGSTGPRYLHVNHNLVIDGAAATVTLNDGGTLIAHNITTDNGGSFTYHGGLLTLTQGDAGFGTGQNLGTGESLTLGSGDRITLNNGTLAIDADADITLANGGRLQARDITTANGGSFQYLGGFLTLTQGDAGFGTGQLLGGGKTLSGAYNIALFDGTLAIDADETVTLDGGSISAKQLTIDGALEYKKGRLSVSQGSYDLGTGGSNPAILGNPDDSGNINLDLVTQRLALFGSDTEIRTGINIVGGDLVLRSATLGAGGSLTFGGLYSSGHLYLNQAVTVLDTGDANNIATALQDGRSNLSTARVENNLFTLNSGASLTASLLELTDGGGDFTLDGGTLSVINGITGDGNFTWNTGTIDLNNDWDATDSILPSSFTTLGLDQSLILSGNLLGGTITLETGSFLSIFRNLGGTINNNGGTLDIRFVEVPPGPPGDPYTPTQSIIGQQISVAGALKLNAGIKAIGRVTVTPGASLSGIGGVEGELTIGGSHQPGASPGIFTVDGNLIYESTATLEIEMDLSGSNPVAGTDFDRVIVNALDDEFTGKASLGGTLVLKTLNDYLGELGDKFLFLTAEGGLSGQFNLDASLAGLANAAGTQWGLYYDFIDGEVWAQVVSKQSPSSFVVVPEPGSAAALLVMTLLVGTRRRR